MCRSSGNGFPAAELRGWRLQATGPRVVYHLPVSVCKNTSSSAIIIIIRRQPPTTLRPGGKNRGSLQASAMEPQNLEAASTYINNVLLARGLLKGGTPIDFAQPENDEGGADGTMARIINLVNDLVLRRDVCCWQHCDLCPLLFKSQILTVNTARSRSQREPSYNNPDPPCK